MKIPDFLLEQSNIMDENQRIAMASMCGDSDYIPKVENSGSIFNEQGGSVQLMHNGLKIHTGGYYGKLITEIIKNLKGHHEPQEEKVFYEVMRRVEKNTTMIELGAHWMYYSIWFNKGVEGAKNICCEPDPVNLDGGKRNVALNRGTNFYFIQAAAGDNDQAYIDLCLDSNPTIITPCVVRTVDCLIKEYGLNKVELLHMDVQGAELSALKGATLAFQKNMIRFVFVSTHHYSISMEPDIHEKCLDLIKEYGGHIISSHSILESFSGDGLIVASFDERDREFFVQTSINHSNKSLFRRYEKDIEMLLEKGQFNYD